MSRPTSSRRFHPRARRDAGFTLLEILVASALMLLMLGLAMMLFDQLLSISDEATATAEMNQNLRAAANLISEDLTMAAAGIPIGGLPLPAGNGSQPVLRPGPCCANTFPAAVGVIPAISPGYGLGPSQAAGGEADTSYDTGAITNSDEMTLIEVDPIWNANNFGPGAGPKQATLTAASPTQVTLDPSTNLGAGSSQLNVGDLMMIQSTNNQAAIVMVTAINGDIVDFDQGDPMQLNQPLAASGNLAAIETVPPASLHAFRLEMISYYLNFANPNQPALMRQFGDQAPMKVATGITGLQFTYDLADGITIDQRTTTQPNQIRKVNFVLSARSAHRGLKTHRYYANAIATAVMIRNLEYRNRYCNGCAQLP